MTHHRQDRNGGPPSDHDLGSHELRLVGRDQSQAFKARDVSDLVKGHRHDIWNFQNHGPKDGKIFWTDTPVGKVIIHGVNNPAKPRRSPPDCSITFLPKYETQEQNLGSPSTALRLFKLLDARETLLQDADKAIGQGEVDKWAPLNITLNGWQHRGFRYKSGTSRIVIEERRLVHEGTEEGGEKIDTLRVRHFFASRLHADATAGKRTQEKQEVEAESKRVMGMLRKLHDLYTGQK